jgi:hypothetical protein
MQFLIKKYVLAWTLVADCLLMCDEHIYFVSHSLFIICDVLLRIARAQSKQESGEGKKAGSGKEQCDRTMASTND